MADPDAKKKEMMLGRIDTIQESTKYEKAFDIHEEYSADGALTGL